MPEQLKNEKRNHGKRLKWAKWRYRKTTGQKKQGSPNPLNIEWTRNAQVAEKCEKYPGIHVTEKWRN